MTDKRTAVLRKRSEQAFEGTPAGFAVDVAEGLTSFPKHLPPKWFYDAHGSKLFEEITRLPEYYLTRTEESILRANAEEMIALAGENLALIELGAGSAVKTGLLIEALLRRQLRVTYVPIDVSASALREAELRLRRQFPRLRVAPQVSDFTAGLEHLESVPGRKLVLFIGSSIGNFEPGPASRLLREVHAWLRPGDAFLLGTDLVKDPGLLVRAYDDQAGVTAAFNRNLLARINRELGGSFDLLKFRHVAEWNGVQSRMEIYLESIQAQRIRIRSLGLLVDFAAGERIHTENSYKYSLASGSGLLAAAGFIPAGAWTDSRRWFALHLARRGADG